MTINQSVFRNACEVSLSLYIEPEGALFMLPPGEEVVLRDHYSKMPMTLKYSHDSEGGPILSIWPGDGELIVTKDGIDVLELLSQDSVVPAS